MNSVVWFVAVLERYNIRHDEPTAHPKAGFLRIVVLFLDTCIVPRME